jgi:hypothetical protein
MYDEAPVDRNGRPGRATGAAPRVDVRRRPPYPRRADSFRAEKSSMNRRDFLTRVGGLALAVPSVLSLVACGESGGGDAGSAGTPSGDAFVGETTESAGHTHTVTVRCSDVDSGEAVTYASSRASGHTHNVPLNTVQLAKLASGGSLTLETRSLHLHTWVLSPRTACA